MYHFLVHVKGVLVLQNRFAAFVEQADKSKFALRQALKDLEATYKTLLNEHLGRC